MRSLCYCAQLMVDSCETVFNICNDSKLCAYIPVPLCRFRSLDAVLFDFERKCIAFTAQSIKFIVILMVRQYSRQMVDYIVAGASINGHTLFVHTYKTKMNFNVFGACNFWINHLRTTHVFNTRMCLCVSLLNAKKKTVMFILFAITWGTVCTCMTLSHEHQRYSDIAN